MGVNTINLNIDLKDVVALIEIKIILKKIYQIKGKN